MSSAVLALLSALALQDGVTRVTAGARAEGRYEKANDPGAPGDWAVVSLGLNLGLDHERPSADFALAYRPEFLVEPRSGDDTSYHRATLGTVWRAAPRWRLTGRAEGGYGRTDLRLRPPAPGDPLNPIVGRATPLTMLALAEGGAQYTAAPTVRLDGTVRARVSGGATTAYQTLAPLQYGPGADLRLEWSVAPLDRLATVVLGETRRVETALVDAAAGLRIERSRAWSASAIEVWEHGTPSEWRLRLGGGVAAGAGRSAARAFPAGEAELLAAFRRPAVIVTAGLRSTPYFDPITGDVYGRAEASASVQWSATDRIRLDGGLAVGRVTDGPQEGQLVGYAHASAGWAVSQELELSAGVRALRQDAPRTVAEAPGTPLAVPSFHQWGAYLAVAYVHRQTP